MEHYKARQEIFVKGRFVGAVEGGVFRKSIKGSRHILRDPQAICVPAVVLDAGYGITAFEITDTEGGKIYQTDRETFLQYCFKVERGGWEPQLGLRLERWITSMHQGSRTLGPGEAKFKRGNGKRTRTPKGQNKKPPRQGMFRGW